MAREKSMDLFRTDTFRDVCTTLLGLFRMGLVNIIAFAVMKTSCKIVFIKSLCLQMTADIREIPEKVKRNVNFILV